MSQPTAASGSVCNLLPGTYTVTEILKPLWKNVTALTQTVVLGCENRTGIDFYNDPLVCLSGTKFNNCTKLGLDGWTIIVKDSTGVVVGQNITANGGKWQVCDLLPGNLYSQRDPQAQLEERDCSEPECDSGLRQPDRH